MGELVVTTPHSAVTVSVKHGEYGFDHDGYFVHGFVIERRPYVEITVRGTEQAIGDRLLALGHSLVAHGWKALRVDWDL